MLKYFEVLDIPFSFRPDLSRVKKNFYQLSRALHPDFYSLDSDSLRSASELRAGDLNIAYETISHPEKRLKYILTEFGLLSQDENKSLDSEFLMEMMDINEELLDLQMDFDSEAQQSLSQKVGSFQKMLNEALEDAYDKYESSDNTEIHLENILDIYLKSRYLLRIRENISKFAPPSNKGQ